MSTQVPQQALDALVEQAMTAAEEETAQHGTVNETGDWSPETEWERYGNHVARLILAAAIPPGHTLYEELLFAVGKKYPGETRHQTALRYIQQAESPTAAQAPQGQE